jgi:16S rRNA (guanine(1405)-N(7))-methyltransferase
MKAADRELEALVTAVTQTAKYANISPDLVQRIGARELASRRTRKEAIKATKNKLHQIGGAYFEAKLDYGRMLAQLNAAENDSALRAVCIDLMRRHVSTKERLPFLEDFYAEVLKNTEDIRVVVDVACGLNPLAISWMPFNAEIEYHAYDIYADMIAFVGDFLGLMGVNGRAQTRDIISQPPTEPADLIFILKTLPVLEQVEKGAAARLLDALQARYLLISFPAQSIGGRGKGMVQNYEAQFYSWIDGRSWQVQRFEFPTELAFLVTT